MNPFTAFSHAQSGPVQQHPGQSSRKHKTWSFFSKDEEEEDDNQKNSKQNANGAPLSAICNNRKAAESFIDNQPCVKQHRCIWLPGRSLTTGHMWHLGQFLHDIVQSWMCVVHLMAEIIQHSAVGTTQTHTSTAAADIWFYFHVSSEYKRCHTIIYSRANRDL